MTEKLCLKDGDRCARCVLLAQGAFDSIYRAEHPNMSNDAVTTVIENIPFAAPVQEESRLAGIQCSDRQLRAKNIGVYMANKYR